MTLRPTLFRCCQHCAEDPVHDVETDCHTVPCGGRWGICSDGGDESAGYARESDLAPSWHDCDDPYSECSCG